MVFDSAPIFERMVPRTWLEAVPLEAVSLEAMSFEAMTAIEAMTAS